MSRPASGQVVERRTNRGVTFALRFRAAGRRQYVTLGSAKDGWTRQRAEEELQNALADVRRGTWKPATAPSPAGPTDPSFHEFASEWAAGRELEGLAPRTIETDRWALTHHLLAFFANHKLSEITAEEVDRYKRAKLRDREHGLVDRPLSNQSINATLNVLGYVLEAAVEYGHVEANAARGKRRRLPAAKQSGVFLEPEQVTALLNAAGELDAEGRSGARRHRRALLATLAYAGLRIGELLALEWRDVDLARARLHVRESKTEAGRRTVDIQPELHDHLAELKVRAATRAGLVFGTATGRPDNRTNVRRRVLARAVERANERLAEHGGGDPIPAGLTPHGLRRTFASWLVAEGEDPAYVMSQLGHRDPKMTLGLYAKALKSKRRRPHARRVEAAPMGTSAQSRPTVGGLDRNAF